MKNSLIRLRSTETQPACNCRGKRPTNVCPSPPQPPPLHNPPPLPQSLYPNLSSSEPQRPFPEPEPPPPPPPKQKVLIGVVLCLSSTPASTTTALSAFFLVDFAFVFKANLVDFKIKLLSWNSKECTAQCSLHRCPWRFIHCRRRLVSHSNHFA